MLINRRRLINFSIISLGIVLIASVICLSFALFSKNKTAVSASAAEMPVYTLDDFVYGPDPNRTIIYGMSSSGFEKLNSGITIVNIPDGIIKINDRAFAVSSSGYDDDYAKIEEIIFSDTVEEIGEEAFAGTAIYNLTIPGTVKDIENCAFKDCDLLEHITICEGVEYLGSLLFDCAKLKSIVIPSSITYFDNPIINHCPELEILEVNSTLLSATGNPSFSYIFGAPNKTQTILANKSYYDTIYSSYSSSAQQQLTYKVPVEFKLADGASVSYERVAGKALNYVKTANGSWATDSKFAIPTQLGGLTVASWNVSDLSVNTVIEKGTASLTYQVASVAGPAISVDEKTKVYDKQPITATVPEDFNKTYLEVFYEGVDGTSYSSTAAPANAGKYTATVRVKSDYDFTVTGSQLSDAFEITKAAYDLEGVEFEGLDIEYDGEFHTIGVTGTLPEGVTVKYYVDGDEEGVTALEQYKEYCNVEITAKFLGDYANYFEIDDISVTVKITKARYDMSGVKFDTVEVNYDGAAHALELDGTETLPAEITYEFYIGEEKIEALPEETELCEIEVTVKFFGDDNHEPIDDMVATLKIKKIAVDMSGIEFEDASFYYDGQIKKVAITGILPAGVNVTLEIYYNGTKVTSIMNLGTYTVKAIFTTPDEEHYEPIEDKIITVYVTEKPVTPVETVTPVEPEKTDMPWLWIVVGVLAFVFLVELLIAKKVRSVKYITPEDLEE